MTIVVTNFSFFLFFSNLSNTIQKCQYLLVSVDPITGKLYYSSHVFSTCCSMTRTVNCTCFNKTCVNKVLGTQKLNFSISTSCHWSSSLTSVVEKRMKRKFLKTSVKSTKPTGHIGLRLGLGKFPSDVIVLWPKLKQCFFFDFSITQTILIESSYSHHWLPPRNYG